MDYPSNPDVGLYNGKFTDGDPQSDIPASIDPASHMNAITDELIALISGAGLVPAEADLTQVFQAVKRISGTFVNNANGNPNISDTLLDLPSGLSVVPTSGAPFVSIGPTGSGCQNIWTALDAVAADADWIEVAVNGGLFDTNGSHAGESYDGQAYVAKYGSAPSMVDYKAVLYLASGAANANGDVACPINLTRKIPVDSRRFLLNFGTQGSVYPFPNVQLHVNLTGWGYNPG